MQYYMPYFYRFNFLAFIFLCLSLNACLPPPSTSGSRSTSSSTDYRNTEIRDYPYYKDIEFRTEDWTYDDYIRTVMLFPRGGGIQAQRVPPIVPLAEVPLLELHFDELGNSPHDYEVKIISCDMDWSISDRQDMEFLDDYNEFPIRDYELSFNTKTPFVHYRFSLPPLKLPGNYVIKVYHNDEENVVLSRRFMVYSQDAGVSLSRGVVSGGEHALSNQQLEFQVNYGRLQQVFSPKEQIKVVLRQNYRWDNAIYGLEPAFVRAHERSLDYRFVNFENNFQGGNEFRMFNAQNLRQFGFWIDSIRVGERVDEIFLRRDQPRADFAYTRRFNDINGYFWVNNELGQNPFLQSDYLKVHFFLYTVQPLPGDVYVYGQMSDWRTQERFKMQFDARRGVYSAEVLLKQGLYNYMYTLVRPDGTRDDYAIEGSYFQTENEYDILVYYRPPGERSDLLVGYGRNR
ncbi:MAG: DUF5103 domain-containing protein [Bernardetiaceae bacterium]|nr:DUF5103 domain-containing protein [Bernardetiaceae bacterium]